MMRDVPAADDRAITVHLKERVYEQLKAWAIQEKRSVSAQVAYLIENALAEHRASQDKRG